MTKITPPSTYLESRHGLLREEHGLYFLHLEGTWEEMAEAHGKLLLPQIRRGLVPFFEGFIERHMAHGVLGSVSPAVRRFVAQAIENLIVLPMENAMPPEQKLAVRKLAESTGFSYRESARVLAVPDAAAILGALLAESRSRTLQSMMVGVPACSSVQLKGRHTLDGHLLHGRNLDYDCLGTWDTHRVVSFNKPKGQLAHVSFTTAGAFTSGLTAMNEAGIFLGCNVSSTWDVKPGGIPFHAMHTRIMSEASTLEEALEILRSQPRASGFNLHLSDGKTGEACVIEYSSHHHSVRWMHEDRLIQTNHYQSQQMAKFQSEGPPHTKNNTLVRLKRLESLTEDISAAEPKDIADLLADRFDPDEDRHRPVGHIVACSKNVQAVVADVTEKKAWVSNGLAPAMDSQFIGFSLDAHLADPSSPFEVLERDSKDPLSQGERQSIQKHQQSYMAYIHNHDKSTAESLMEEAMSLAPNEGAYPLLLAMIRLSRADGKGVQKAALLSLPLQRRAYQKALSMTLLAYGHDLCGERQAAKAWYQKALNTLGNESPALVEELKHRLKNPWQASECQTIRVDYIEPGLGGL